MTPSELAALKALVQAEEARQASAQLPDILRADSTDVLQLQEDPMYSWICPVPYRHYNRYKVWFRNVQGTKKSLTFAAEGEATSWITEAQKLLVKDGRPIHEVVTSYLASRLTGRKPIKASTMVTLRYRLQSVIQGRERVSIEAFPWTLAWTEKVAKQSRASQIGILTSLQGLLRFAGLRGRQLEGCVPEGEVRAGKEQLHIDEARRFIAAALIAGDPLALAAATMAFTGCRPGEVLNLKARDVDDGGSLLHIYGTKTAKAKRPIKIDPAFQPILLGAASGKLPDELLFPHVPERHRETKDAAKAKLDALLRRVGQLCKASGVKRVVSHSLRGLNATLRLTGGASDDTITQALGHISIDTTKRSYFAPGIAEQTESTRAFGRLLGASKAA